MRDSAQQRYGDNRSEGILGGQHGAQPGHEPVKNAPLSIALAVADADASMANWK